MADRLLVMLNGHIVDETTPAALESEPAVKQRYLGVTARAEDHPETIEGAQ